MSNLKNYCGLQMQMDTSFVTKEKHKHKEFSVRIYSK